MHPGDPASENRIAGIYEVDFGHPLEGVAPGQRAFAVIDHGESRGHHMAAEVAPHLPARSGELLKFQAGAIPGVLCPLAHGRAADRNGRTGFYVVMPVPPGPALLAPGVGAFPPWPEADILHQVLRPAALALDGLRARGITHRAIRPENLFRAAAGEPVVLGGAWAAPPALFQGAIFEPPYAAMCTRAGCGNGSPADDVYALGVTMLVLALGHAPMAGLPGAAVIQAKLERGSFAALVGDERLPPVIQDIVRGMLAEDPEHRPTPALLADIEVARGRRVAARPPRRAQKALEIAGHAAWTARTLAFALAREPAAGVPALRNGMVDRWIRRNLGDSALAARQIGACRHTPKRSSCPTPPTRCSVWSPTLSATPSFCPGASAPVSASGSITSSMPI